MKGLVLKSTGSWYAVKGQDGKMYQCRVRGKLKLKGIKTTNPVAVGDRVEVILEEKNSQQGIIQAIEPRENYIIRKSVHKTGHGHILAANVDQALILATLAFPQTSFGFIDRFLVACESFRIPALLVFNKIDILSEEEINFQNQIASIYENIGYKVLHISAQDGRGLNDVKATLNGKTTLVGGHSGVGKSTMLNALAAGISQKVDEVSNFSLKGKHTTTFAEMFEIGKDTYVIDSPGIKELGLMDMESWEISHYFPEMRDFLGQCKFNNCLHTNEPGCKVLEALVHDEIAETRFESYLSILEDEDNRR